MSKLFELISDAVFVHTLEGKFLYFNESAYKSRGYTIEELSEMSVKELDSPNCPDILRESIKGLLETGEMIIERVHRCKDGTDILVELHSRIITLGNQTLVLTVARDIAERKKAEIKLRHSDMIFDNSLDMFCVASYDGFYKVLNPAWAKTLG